MFFADYNHVAIQVLASENEHNLITTNLRELLAMETKAKDEAAAVKDVRPQKSVVKTNLSVE